jgi:hypothetical protein
MKRMNKMVPLLGDFSSGASLGGKLSLYRKNKASTRKVSQLPRFSTFKKEACGSLPERNIICRTTPGARTSAVSVLG